MAESDSDASEMERRQSAVQELARRFSHQSGAQSGGLSRGLSRGLSGGVGDYGGNPRLLFANDDPSSPLNPSGPNFSARVWARALAQYSRLQR